VKIPIRPRLRLFRPFFAGFSVWIFADWESLLILTAIGRFWHRTPRSLRNRFIEPLEHPFDHLADGNRTIRNLARAPPAPHQLGARQGSCLF
jgi:hypothetical protein